MFGNLGPERTAMFVEAIDHILAIWASDAPYNIKGKYWQISTERTLDRAIGQGVMLKPDQRPHPPIVVAAMSPNSASVRRAGERGWSVISANFLQPQWVASHWQQFCGGRRAAGLPARSHDWRVAKSVFVADDEATAQSYAKSTTGPYGFYYGNLMRKLIGNGRPDRFKTTPDMRDEDITHEFVIDSLVIAGTVDSVVEQIVRFRERAGAFGTLVYAGHDWVDPRLARRSMELMATKVMPQVNKVLGEQSD